MEHMLPASRSGMSCAFITVSTRAAAEALYLHMHQQLIGDPPVPCSVRFTKGTYDVELWQQMPHTQEEFDKAMQDSAAWHAIV